jgi:hypothetical protein
MMRMNKEEAIEQLYRLSLDWEENGLDTKLNQTDINAIGMVISELEIANKKLEDIENLVKTKMYVFSFNQMMILANEDDYKELLKIIGGE